MGAGFPAPYSKQRHPWTRVDVCDVEDGYEALEFGVARPRTLGTHSELNLAVDLTVCPLAESRDGDQPHKGVYATLSQTSD